MSGFSYDKERVAQSIQDLSAISDEIKQIAPDVESGLNIIRNARGINYIDWKQDSVNSFVQDCNDVLDELLTNLNNQVSAIEAYKEGQEGSILKRLGATMVMAGSKLVEGVFTFGEQLVDALAGTLGFVGGIFVPEFRESVSEWIAKDRVGDWFNEMYTSNNAFSAWVDKYSWMSYDGVASTILKGAGTAAPTIVLACLTGGSSLAATGAVAGISGAAGLGGKMQSELQDGTDYSKAFGKGLITGVADAALTFALSGATKAAKAENSLLESSKALTKVNQLKSGAKDIVANIANKTGLSKVAHKIASSPSGIITTGLLKNTKMAKLLTKTGKAIKDTASITVEAIAKNPKAAAVVAVGTGGIYTASKFINTSNGTPSTEGNGNVNDSFIDTPEPMPEPNPDPDYTIPDGKDNVSSDTGDTGNSDTKVYENNVDTDFNQDPSPQQRKIPSNDGDQNSQNQPNGGEQSEENKPSDGDQNGGNKPSDGDQNGGNKPSDGEQSEGNKPSDGEQNGGNKPSDGDQNGGNKPSDGEQSEGNKPSDGEQSEGNKPSDGEQNDGDQTNGSDQDDGNKPSGSDNTGGQQVQQPSSQPSHNNPQPSSSGYTPSSNNGGSYGNYTDTAYTPDTSTGQTPSDTIEILDDGTENDTSTTTDIADEPYDEPYIVEPPVDTTTTTTSKKSMAGPILTGVGLAGAAGVGAKVYLDRKKQSESGEFDETVEEDNEENSIVTDEWKDDNDSPGYEDNSSDYDNDSDYNSTPNYEDNSSDYEYPVD